MSEHDVSLDTSFFLWAVQSGYADQVLEFLRQGADLNAVDLYAGEMTPLMYAVSNGHTHIAQLLIQHGADVHASNQFGETSLHIAAECGYKACLEILLVSGADVNVDSMLGSPLYGALSSKHKDCAHILIEHGGDLSDCSLMELVIDTKQYDFMDLLIEKGFSLNMLMRDDKTPLHLAAIQGDATAADKLLRAGATLEIKTNSGQTPLLCGVAHNQAQMVQFLLTEGADANVKDSTYSCLTSCHVAAQMGYLDVLGLLIRGGANPNIGDRYGHTPMVRAILRDKEHTAALLIQENCDTDYRCPNFSSNVVKLGYVVDLAPTKHMTHILGLLVVNGCSLSLGKLHDYFIHRDVGKDSSSNEKKLMEWVEYLSHNPWSLQNLCRQKIRSCLGCVISGKLCQLNLPTKMKDYLYLSDYAEPLKHREPLQEEPASDLAYYMPALWVSGPPFIAADYLCDA